MLALAREQKAVDLVSVVSKLGDRVPQQYLKEIMEITPISDNAAGWAHEVRKASMNRELREIGESLILESTPFDDPTKTIGEVQRKLEQIEARDTQRDLADTQEMIQRFYLHRANIDCGGGGFVATGFQALDELLGGGMLNSGLYVLAARPGNGKTTFALQIADHIAKSGPVLFVSLEMDIEQIMAKRISRDSGVSSQALLMGRVTQDDYMRVKERVKILNELKFFVNKAPSATVDDISFLARKVKGIKALVIDYFGIIQTPGDYKSRYENMTVISGQLKALARKMKIPILCLAQLNRENQMRKDKRPILSDLRDTGAIEQDADAVIFLHKTADYDNTEQDAWGPTPLEIIVAKNRHAGTGKIDAAFYMATSKIAKVGNSW